MVVVCPKISFSQVSQNHYLVHSYVLLVSRVNVPFFECIHTHLHIGTHTDKCNTPLLSNAILSLNLLWIEQTT